MANGRPFGFYDPATSPNLGACGRLKIKNKKPETPSLFFCGKKKMKNEGSFFAV
jgi:predicted ferric reductase